MDFYSFSCSIYRLSTLAGSEQPLLAVKNALVGITAVSTISDCGKTGMLFNAHHAIKMFILNSSNNRNFPLAEGLDFFFFSKRKKKNRRKKKSLFSVLYVNKTLKSTGSSADMKQILVVKGSSPSDVVLSLCLEQKCEVKADDLEQICELGRGAYGVVDKMRHVPSGLIMAVKVRESKSPRRSDKD